MVFYEALPLFPPPGDLNVLAGTRHLRNRCNMNFKSAIILYFPRDMDAVIRIPSGYSTSGMEELFPILKIENVIIK
jgi:hypothetical protein